MGVGRENAVFGKRFGDRTAHEERRALASGGVGGFVGISVNGLAARCTSGAVPNGQDARCPSAPGFVFDGGVAVVSEAGVAVEGARGEGEYAVLDDVARLGAPLRRVVGVAGVAVKRFVVADGHKHKSARFHVFSTISIATSTNIGNPCNIYADSGLSGV